MLGVGAALGLHRDSGMKLLAQRLDDELVLVELALLDGREGRTRDLKCRSLAEPVPRSASDEGLRTTWLKQVTRFARDDSASLSP